MEMLIPKYYRQHLKYIGHHRWFWSRIDDWAFGERYKFRDGMVAYLAEGEIISLRRGANFVWRKEDING